MIRNKKILLIIAIILIILLTGCNEKNKNDDLNEKVKQELDYIDIQTVSVLNKLNNITLRNYIITEEEIQNKDQSTTEKSGSGEKGQQNSQNEQKESDSQSSSDSKLEETNVTVTSMEPQSILALDETKIEWDVIRNKVETINEAWSIILLDLSNVNIDSNDILGFSNALNDTMISVKEENKTNTLINASKMYSYIPKYEKQISQNTGVNDIKQVKSYILNAYSKVEQNNWSEIESNINLAEEVFKNIMNNIEYAKNKEFKLNRTYVLIKELQNSLKYMDKKIFFVKYKNLIENLNTL